MCTGSETTPARRKTCRRFLRSRSGHLLSSIDRPASRPLALPPMARSVDSQRGSVGLINLTSGASKHASSNVFPFLVCTKLCSSSFQNSVLARALREIGCLERTLSSSTGSQIRRSGAVPTQGSGRILLDRPRLAYVLVPMIVGPQVH